MRSRRTNAISLSVMGLSPSLEGEEMPVKVDGFVGGDRTRIEVPLLQEEFLKKLHGLDKPVVLVLLNGSTRAIPWAAEHIPAIVEAWYPGQAGGEAVADALFGDYSPGAGCQSPTFTLHTHQLGYYDEGMHYAVHPGPVEVLVGRSSQDLPLAGCFEIVGKRTQVDKVFFSHVSVK
jgi:beta-glucosidase